MPYKILQTQENERELLTVVPSLWETDGLVSWPPIRCDAAMKMDYKKRLMDGNSVPHPDWKRIRCKLKRTFETYEEAQKEWKTMSDKSDTESDATQPASLPNKRKVKSRNPLGRENFPGYSQMVKFKVNMNFKSYFCL